jgi:hypothetical protein
VTGRRSRGAAALLVAAMPGLAGAAPRPSRAPARAIVLAQFPASAAPGPALAGGTLRTGFGTGGRLLLVPPGGKPQVLTRGFHSAADPEVSFDGQLILFAAKKAAEDPWCLWEMRTDGSGERRVTCGEAGARQPVYLSTVYTITPTNVEPWVQVAFVGVNPGERNEAGVAHNTSLWSCKTDGTALRRLTYNLSNDMDPVVLPDGRLVYAGWLRHSTDHGPNGRIPLLGVNLDGTDDQVYAGDEGRRVKQMPAPTASGQVVFVESDEVAGDGAGRLASVSQRRPLHSYRSLTGEAEGLFHSPSALPDGRVLVSWRPADGSGSFGVYRLDPATGARERAFDDPAWHDVQAKLVAPRPVPDARSSVVRDDDPEGKLFAVDVNLHDLGAKLPKGAAKRLRVVEGVPASESKPAGRRLLGEVPLAGDGSFQVQVPANTPIQLQILDVDGLALRRSAWVWVRNHAAQGCVGCHEDPERTPPNRFTQALHSPAPALNLPPDQRRTVSYAADVRPLVEAKCLSCHAAGGKGPRLDSEEALAAWSRTGEARRSPLVWHLLGRATARPWDPEAGAASPKAMPIGTEPLTADDIRTFVEWIDLGGQP